VTPLRRRGLLLLCLALVCGGLAASQVREHERRAAAAVGPLVPVVVATRELPADHRLGEADVGARRLPARFLPPDTLADPAELVGARTAVAIPAGAYLTASLLGAAGSDAADHGSQLRAGERVVEVRVAGALASAQPGARVDVVVSTQPAAGGGRTFVALEDVELLGLHGHLATLHVTARQAVYLTAAANFAREIRLLLRPPGDRRHIGPVAVGEDGL
jgi:pilus assembly protein CpaB